MGIITLDRYNIRLFLSAVFRFTPPPPAYSVSLRTVHVGVCYRKCSGMELNTRLLKIPFLGHYKIDVVALLCH